MFQAERTESTKAMAGMFKVKAEAMSGWRTVSKARVIDDETAEEDDDDNNDDKMTICFCVCM